MKPKKKNPADDTGRNRRATRKTIEELRKEISDLRKDHKEQIDFLFDWLHNLGLRSWTSCGTDWIGQLQKAWIKAGFTKEKKR